MAIFNKHDEQSISSSETTIISRGAVIDGTLNCSARLHIDGEVKGEIISTNIVVVGKNGKFIGSIKAKKLILSGFIEGDADCDSVELLVGSNFKGKITSVELMIEAKAKFNGESKIKEQGEIN